jgi:carbon monoxide dehydrogenase subunit G
MIATPAVGPGTALSTHEILQKVDHSLKTGLSSGMGTRSAAPGANSMRFSRVFRSVLLGLTCLAATALAPSFASADTGDGAPDPQVARLLAAKGTLKWNHGTSSRYGHAEALVGTNANDLARAAADYGHYKDIHPKFSTARVVGKEAGKTDVYMKYPVKIGPMKIELHEVMRFDAERVDGTTHVIEAHGIKGDMTRGHTRITIKQVDATHSLLSVDVLLDPKIPAPQVLVDEELRDGAGDFVNGLKDRAQGHPGPVVSL